MREESILKMKIGIVTFYGGSNYGALLQAYGLRIVLEQMGHQVCFIPFPFSKRNKYSFYRVCHSRSIVAARAKVQTNRDLEIIRDSFLPWLPEIKIEDAASLRTAVLDLDACIVGSDQMWNPAWCVCHLPDVFLQFGKPSMRRIAYSVSLCATSWPDASTERVGEYLRTFAAVSVREASAVPLLKSIGGVTVEWLLDPTLLAGRQVFDDLNKDASPPSLAEPYIFSYILKSTPSPHTAILIKRSSAAFGGMKVYDQIESQHCFGLHAKRTVRDWLHAIKNAQFVVTNSFHGVVFSILFHRPFVCCLGEGTAVAQGMNERLYSFLTRLSLMDRIVDTDVFNFSPRLLPSIDWTQVDACLENWREDSFAFLKNGLS